MKKKLLIIIGVIASLLLCIKVYAMSLEKPELWDFKDFNIDDVDVRTRAPSIDGGIYMLYSVDKYEDPNDENNYYKYYGIIKYDKDSNITFNKEYLCDYDCSSFMEGEAHIFENKEGNLVVYGNSYKYYKVENENKIEITKEVAYAMDVFEDVGFGRIMIIDTKNNTTKTIDLYNSLDEGIDIFEVKESSDGKYFVDGYKRIVEDDETEYYDFFMKIDDEGNEIWNKDLTGISYGNIYPTNDGGAYLSYQDFDEDTKFYKYNSNGEILKDGEEAKSIGNISYRLYGFNGNDIPLIFIDKDNNIIVFGSEEYYADEDEDLMLIRGRIIKYDKDGNEIINEILDFKSEGELRSGIADVLDDLEGGYIVFHGSQLSENMEDFKYKVSRITIDGSNINREIINEDLFADYGSFFEDRTLFASPSYVYTIIEYDLHTYSINRGVNATIGAIQNGTISLSKNNGSIGDEITITVNPDLGYELDKLMVNGNEITGNKFNLNGNDEVTATFKAIRYKFISGMNSVYNNTNMEFKLDGELSLLDKVYVDDNLLDSENYTTRSGSTIIVLDNNYLKELGDGTHRIKATYTTGVEDETTFVKGEETTPVTPENPTPDGAKTKGNTNPVTGDNILASILLALFSLVGISSVVFYTKKDN